MAQEALAALVVLLPLLGATVIGLFGFLSPAFRAQEKVISSIATAMVAIPFAILVYFFLNFHGEPIDFKVLSWMTTQNLSLDFSYRLDQLSLLMGLIVTGIGSLIHIYSSGYMHGDSGYYKFFLYLNLFIFAMNNLILGDNLIVTFLGWEGVGACSYFLIGFWFTDMNKAKAAQKAFVANRIGDFAFLVGVFIVFNHVGSLNYQTIIDTGLPAEKAFWVTLLFFIAATGKSAQIPLYVWLPDAMAGPTPVSALIHAATMVTSGIYLIARLSPIYVGVPEVLALISLVGGLTAIVAALIAISQYDIKKVLAYSTVSQLGFMFMALGAGAFSTAIFHVMTHAFFKACLFLGSGSVIHAMDHTHAVEDGQDIRTMGGLKKYMPSTYWTFQISTWAIAGIPLLSGFFSKDEILAKVFFSGYFGFSNLYYVVWGIGALTALLTAFYMTRLTTLTFKGKERFDLPGHGHAHGHHGHDDHHVHDSHGGHGHDDHGHHEIHAPHESPAVMTFPLWVLATLAIFGGYLGLPEIIDHGHLNWITHHWLAGGGHAEGAGHAAGLLHNRITDHPPLMLEGILIGVSILIAFAGVFLAESMYGKQGLAADDKVKKFFGSFYKVLQNKFYVDEVYNALIIRPFVAISDFIVVPFDKYVVDGLVNSTAGLTQSLGQYFRKAQTGIAQHYAFIMILGVVFVLAYLLTA